MFKALLCLALVALCVAQPGPDDQGMRDRARNQRSGPRAVDIAMGPGGNSVVLNAVDRTNPRSRPRIFFSFFTLGFPRFRARFFSRDEDSRAGFQYRVALLGIAEYNATASGDFDANAITKRWAFAGADNWSSISRTDLTVDGVTVSDFSTSNNNGPAGSVATIHFALAPQLIRDAARNRTLSPSSLKFDFKLTNWPYTFPNSRVAFILAVEASRGAWQSAPAQGNPAANADSDASAGVAASIPVGPTDSDLNRFGWVNNLLAKFNATTTNNIPLRYSSIMGSTSLSQFQQPTNSDNDRDDSETRKIVAFTFDGQPMEVFWDPEVSVDAAPSAASALQTSLALIVALAALLGLML